MIVHDCYERDGHPVIVIINITIFIIILIMIMIKVDMSKMDIPPALLMKSNDHEISREEETTVILQVCRRKNHL